MPLIEGIGDEVLQVFTLLIILIITVVAWWSTQTSERPPLRTVLILERRGARQVSGETPIAPPEPTPGEDDNKTAETSSVQTSEAVINQVAENVTENVDVSSQPGTAQCDLEVEPSCTSRQSCSEVENTSRSSETSAGSENVDVESEIVSEVLEEENSSGPPPDEQQQSIRIRLKYLNDELKLVDGNLEEQLGDFKRRHFSLELSGRKRVRLIFNGQALVQDTWTLGHCGLFDNCVVHCLVHNPRTPPPSPNLNERSGSQRPGLISTWVLSNVLLSSLSLLLGLAWYGRYQYAQLFTTTTTVALVGLTGVYTVSLVGLYTYS